VMTLLLLEASLCWSTPQSNNGISARCGLCRRIVITGRPLLLSSLHHLACRHRREAGIRGGIARLETPMHSALSRESGQSSLYRDAIIAQRIDIWIFDILAEDTDV